MNFDFSDEQKLLQQTARDYLEANSPLATCRAIFEGDQSYAVDLWKGAAEMGWQGAVVQEQYGGAEFGHLELAMIATHVWKTSAHTDLRLKKSRPEFTPLLPAAQ